MTSPATLDPASRRAPEPAPPLARCTVAVVHGGRSGERAVSLETGRAVLAALSDAGDGRGPRRVLGVEVGPDGRWCVGERWLDPLRAVAALEDVDLFFLGLHGGEGEGGGLQGLLSTAGRRFTGSHLAASAVCLDKVFARELFAAAGGRVAPGVLVARGEAVPRELPRGLGGEPAAAWFVKPRRGGSSVDTACAASRGELERAVAAVHAAGDDALVETRLEAVEATCAVLGNRGDELVALTPLEIRPHAGRFFDYEEKYSPAGALELCPPESLDAAACARLAELARRAHRALGCDGYSRSDFLVPDGGRGEPVFLETNTLPGLTPRSLVPQAAAHDGLDFRSLCLRILELARVAPADFA